MAQMMTSGEVLREARTRKGYELATVARRLRIRPDILRAIEEGDFSAMPPKGYARNMVNAYARLLGLNATDIVNMYLDENYAHQVEKARGKARGSGFVMEPETRRSRLRQNLDASRTGAFGGSSRTDTQESGLQGDQRAGSTQRMSRHLYDDRTQFSRDDYGATHNRTVNPNGSRDFRSNHSGYSGTSFAALPDNTRSRRRERTIHVGQTPMEYKPSRLPAIFQSRLVVGIAIAAVIALILVLVFFVFLRGGQSHDEDVAQLPVSGVSDTTEDSESSSSASVEVAPTSARIVYSVLAGQECYLETFADGKIVSGETLTGPDEKTVETKTTWTISTWTPEALRVTVNGEEVTLTPNEEYGGAYAYTVDFAKILQEWNKTHGNSASTREAAVANAANAASQEKSQAAAQAAAQSAQSAQAVSQMQSVDTQTTDEYYDGYDDGYYDESTYADDQSYYDDTVQNYYEDETVYYDEA